MYSVAWLALVSISLMISLAAFVWGVRNGQFSDQTRMRFLPLRDQETKAPPGNPAKLTLEVYALMGIFACGLLVMLAPILLTYMN